MPSLTRVDSLALISAISSCLVNPRACYEDELELKLVSNPKKIAIVGAGPAGLSAAITAAQVGHQVTLFEKEQELGGQLNLAKKVPGKEEFWGLVSWYENMIKLLPAIEIKLNHTAEKKELVNFDKVRQGGGRGRLDPHGSLGQDGPDQRLRQAVPGRRRSERHAPARKT